MNLAGKRKATLSSLTCHAILTLSTLATAQLRKATSDYALLSCWLFTVFKTNYETKNCFEIMIPNNQVFDEKKE